MQRNVSIDVLLAAVIGCALGVGAVLLTAGSRARGHGGRPADPEPLRRAVRRSSEGAVARALRRARRR